MKGFPRREMQKHVDNKKISRKPVRVAVEAAVTTPVTPVRASAAASTLSMIPLRFAPTGRSRNALPRYRLALPPSLAPFVNAPEGALRALTGPLRCPPLPSRLPLVLA